ncbi:hypothetical protein D9M68_617870 [compost metagenome]
MPRIAARLEDHQRRLAGGGQQHIAVVAGRAVHQVHPVAQVLQQVDEGHGDTALGLEAGGVYPRHVRQPLADGAPLRRAAVLVDPHQGGHLALQAVRQGIFAGHFLLTEFLEAVADQPGAVPQVILEVGLQRLEVGVAEGATESPNGGLADAEFFGDGGGGLEWQRLQVGQHVVGNGPRRRSACGQAGFQAFFE